MQEMMNPQTMQLYLSQVRSPDPVEPRMKLIGIDIKDDAKSENLTTGESTPPDAASNGPDRRHADSDPIDDGRQRQCRR